MTLLKRAARNLIGLILLAGASCQLNAVASELNGFDLSGAAIPENEILRGGPPRDGIPSIDNPLFVSPDQADFLEPEHRVMGVFLNGVAKAYPTGIMVWHEIANDTFGQQAVAITYCPLCGTGMAFESDIDGERLEFGVSGLLYNSDVLLYDRGSESLWSQVARAAVTGPKKGQRLTMVAMAHTSWADWSARHPDTLVLSTDTGFNRDYGRDPYAGYEASEQTIFPAGKPDKRFHPKEFVIGLELGESFKAYPFSELGKAGETSFSDTLNGQQVTVEFSPEHNSGRVLDAGAREIPTVIAFWFAWTAFHPDTEVFVAP